MNSTPSDDQTIEEEISASVHTGAYADIGHPPQPLRPRSELEEAIGYTFRDKERMEAALVHKSYLHQVPDFYLGSNERLEFLGDAVLSLIVSTDLFTSHPDESEGELTALRGALVRKNTLAEVGEPLKLGEFLYMSRGEEAAGGRTRASNMAHAVEAILGAVYLDGGYEAAVNAWHHMLGEHDDERLHEVLRGDYKSQLQQFTQAHLRLTPVYRLEGTSGPEHSKVFHVEVLVGDRVVGAGEGRNKQIAEQAAAQTALVRLLMEDEHEKSEDRNQNSDAGKNLKFDF